MSNRPCQPPLPDCLPVVIQGIACRVGWRLIPLRELELTEDLRIKSEPAGLADALAEGWGSGAVPPLFAAHSRREDGYAAEGYSLQDGHRRWRAATQRGLRTAPVVWVDMDGFLALMEIGDRLDVRDWVFAALGIRH